MKKIYKKLLAAGLGAALALSVAACGTNKETAKNGFYNLFWGAKVTVQMRVLSAPTFFSIKK